MESINDNFLMDLMAFSVRYNDDNHYNDLQGNLLKVEVAKNNERSKLMQLCWVFFSLSFSLSCYVLTQFKCIGVALWCRAKDVVHLDGPIGGL